MVTDPAPRTQTIRHRSPLGTWEMVACRPAADLRGFVTSYLGYTESAMSFQRRIETPGSEVVMIFNFGAPLGVSDQLRPEAPPASYHSFVGGLSDTYVVTETSGPSHGLQVNFTPLGAHLFLGLPMDEVAHRVVEIDDLLGAFGRRMTARLHEAPTWERRFDILDEIIGARLGAAAAPSPAPGVLWAWGRLIETHGALRVQDLAREVGCTPKHLGTQFRRQIGLAPKVIGRVLRFRRVLELLDQAAEIRWTEIALASGYYDQGHFNRDFRQFTGRTPGDFLRRRLPDRGGVIGD